MALLSSLLSGPTTRVLEGLVREITQQVVRDHNLATKRDVDALRHSLDELERRIAALEVAPTSVQAAAVVEPEVAPTIVQAAAIVEPEAEAEAEPAPDPAHEPVETQSSTRGRKSMRHLLCQIEGCETNHRSKGFCSAHYQQWRRGVLLEYVSPEGLIYDGPRRLQVDRKLAGKTFTLTGQDSQRTVEIDGATITFQAVAA